MVSLLHRYIQSTSVLARMEGRGMEGRDIKRIILALVSLTCYAGPARPTRIYTVAATRCYVQKGTVIRLNP